MRQRLAKGAEVPQGVIDEWEWDHDHTKNPLLRSCGVLRPQGGWEKVDVPRLGIDVRLAGQTYRVVAYDPSCGDCGHFAVLVPCGTLMWVPDGPGVVVCP